MKIYTKGGDKGKTSLLSGERVAKNHYRIEAYGTVDELNSFLALLISDLTTDIDREFLISVQHYLFNIGSKLAVGKDVAFDLPGVSSDAIIAVEAEIDRLNEDLSPLKEFILPGSCRLGALAHVCRTVCRRAERLIIGLPETSEITETIVPYMNRLSDYFFVLARWLNWYNGSPEQFWRK